MKAQNYTSNITDKVWASIDEMPIWNWDKILSTGDLKYMFKSNSGRVSNKIAKKWDDLQDQYINEFGLDESFKKKLRLLKKKAKLNYEFVLTKDKFINTLLEIVEADLNSLNIGKSISFHELKDHLEKYKGFRIDPKITTVIEWHYAVKNMTNNGKDD